MAFQLSPGIEIVEKDASVVVPGVSSSVGAVVGNFQWGPVLDPVLVNSEEILVNIFGKPTQTTFHSFFNAANFLSYSSALFVTRADQAGSVNAVSNPVSGVAQINVTNQGANYQTAVVQIIGDGIGAMAQAEIANVGPVASVVVNTTGTGYTQANTTITVQGDGTGAIVQGVFGAGADAGKILSINVISGGINYTTATIVITSTGGVGATATATVDRKRRIKSIIVTEAGFGYSVPPTVLITGEPVTGQAIENAAAVAVLDEEMGIKIRNLDQYEMQIFAGTEDENGTLAPGLRSAAGPFAARYPGELGNSIFVSLADANSFANWEFKDEFNSAPGTSEFAISKGRTNAKDEVHVIVIDLLGLFTGTPGTILEKYSFLSKASDAMGFDGLSNYYPVVIKDKSNYVYVVSHPDGAQNISGKANWGAGILELMPTNSPTGVKEFAQLPTDASFLLQKGKDSPELPTLGELQRAFDLYKDDQTYDISLIPVGNADKTLFQYVVSNIAEVRKDLVVFGSIGKQARAGRTNPIFGSDLNALELAVEYRSGLNSNYAFLDTGYKYQYDKYNDTFRYVTMNADMAGLCARTDQVADPWFSPGGYNRGNVKNAVKLAFNPNKAQRDILYKASINPVVSFPGEGTVLFGDKTMTSKPSAFDRINVRRLFIVCEKAIRDFARFSLFEFNDSITRAQFVAAVEPFLRDVQGRRGIAEFKVICDETNNTPDVIGRNEFRGNILIKPNYSINFITLTFTAVGPTVSFETAAQV